MSSSETDPTPSEVHVMIPVERTDKGGGVRATGPHGERVEPRLLADLLDDCLQAVVQTKANNPKISIELRGQMKTTEAAGLKWILELGASDERTNTVVLRVEAQP